MKPWVRKLLNWLFILATLGVVIVIATSNGDLANAGATLMTLDPLWLLGAFVCWFGCLFFEALSCYRYLRRQHHRISFGRALYVSIIGYYYSNITPGASGGQPMQIYYMSKSGVPVGVATSCAVSKTVFNQFTLIVAGSVLWLCNRDFVSAQLGGVKWIIIIGWLINFAVVPLVLLATFNRPLVQRVTAFLVRLGAKIRLIKDPERAMMHVNTTLDSYHESILRLGRHPWHVAMQLLVSALSMCSLMAVAVCVYHAFGSTFALADTPWYQLLTVAYLLFISTSYTPLPGASGAQEGGFLVFFGGIFPQGACGLALLVWRFFSYYTFLLFGTACVIVENIVSARRKRKAAKKADATEPSVRTAVPDPGE